MSWPASLMSRLLYKKLTDAGGAKVKNNPEYHGW
jgi:hypothetical protein